MSDLYDDFDFGKPLEDAYQRQKTSAHYLPDGSYATSSQAYVKAVYMRNKHIHDRETKYPPDKRPFLTPTGNINDKGDTKDNIER